MNKFEKALMEGHLIERTCKLIKEYAFKVDDKAGQIYRNQLSLKKPVVQNKVLFMTYQNQYTCNPKYITEKLLELYPGQFDIVWVVNKNTIENRDGLGIPQEIRLVQRDTAEGYEELMTAKIWVDNAINCIWKGQVKKPDQVYLNTWHGSLGIKRLDTFDPARAYWFKVADRSNRQINLMLSNSDFECDVFREAYWPDVKSVKIGHARNDIFFHEEIMTDLRKKVLDYYELDEDVTLVLYAPTFRDNKDTKFLNMDYDELYKAVSERFPGKKCKLLLRLHFHNRKSKHASSAAKDQDDFILDATNYPDIQELMAAADIGITDYSSWIYDFMLTRRPCFIYAPDIEHYSGGRGLYYPLESTPFPIATNNEEMSANIVAFDDDGYHDKVEEFLTEKGCMEDGYASDRISKLIYNIVNKIPAKKADAE